MREITVNLVRGSYAVENLVQVHAGAPVDLLLGTDVHRQLGLVVLALRQDGKADELLRGETWKHSVENQRVESPPVHPIGLSVQESGQKKSADCAVIVRLIQTTRLPANYVKTIRAEVHGTGLSSCVFEPESQFMLANQLLMVDAVVEPNERQEVTLVIENHGHHPVRLQKNQT